MNRHSPAFVTPEDRSGREVLPARKRKQRGRGRQWRRYLPLKVGTAVNPFSFGADDTPATEGGRAFPLCLRARSLSVFPHAIGVARV